MSDPHTLARNELDVEGEAALYRAFRKFWHPVAYSSALRDSPLRADLLGEQLVLARLDGRPHAFPDLCLHRGAALSLGSIEDGCLRCAYHGWAYNSDGQCVDVPARRELSGKINAKLHAYPVAEQGGLIWVSLADTPVLDLPEFPEFSDPDFRVLEGPSYDWATSAPRRVENFVDFSHFAFVHDGVLGSRDDPRVEDTEVRRDGSTLVFGRWMTEPDEPGEAADPGLAGGQQPSTRVFNEYHLTMPGTVHLRRTFANGRRYVLVMAASPLGAKAVRSFWFQARDFSLEPEHDASFLDFEALVLQQDKPIVESQRPEHLSRDLSVEMHVRGADSVSVDYRRWLVELSRT